MTNNRSLQQILGYSGLAVFVGALFLVITNWGPVNYFLQQTPEYSYVGGNPYAAADKVVYMGMIQQGYEGSFIMKNLHTIAPQRPWMISPHWWLIGQTARWTGMPTIVSYSLYRVIFSILFLFVLWAFIRHLFKTQRQRLTAFGIVLLSGGAGWFYILKHTELLTMVNDTLKLLYTPTEIYVTEGTTLLNFAQSPLFSLSQLLIILIFFLLVLWRERSWRYQIITGILFAVLTIIHPYDYVIIMFIGGSWAVWQCWHTNDLRPLWRFFIIAIIGAMAFGINILMLLRESVLASWLQQNQVFSPPISRYLWTYATILPFWAVGVWRFWKDKRTNPWWALVVLWSVLVWIMLYLPVNTNRRFINGAHVALALVASYGFIYLYHRIRVTWLRLTYITLFIIMATGATVIYLMINGFNESLYDYGFYYISRDEQNAVVLIMHESMPDARVIVSDERTAMTMGAYLTRPLYRGHQHQTPDTYRNEQMQYWFFAEPQGQHSMEDRLDFLRENDLRYVVVNQSRRDEPILWVETASFLERAFSSGPIEVFRVKK